MKYCYEYPRPAVTVDAAVLVKQNESWSILLIKRKNAPYQGCYALPEASLMKTKRWKMPL